MITIKGYWYDGETSAQAGAVCRIFDSGAIGIESRDDGRTLKTVPGFAVKTSPRLANTPRYLYFATGEKFETEDNDAVDAALKQFKGHSLLHLVHKLESRKGYVLLCLAAVLLFAWAFAKYGVPVTARLIAGRLPPTVYGHAGKQTLQILDRSVFGPTELDDADKRRLVTRFEPVVADHHEYDLKILFRKGGPMGPNAFALPDGTIVFTDEMVRLAEHDNELVAVLAHEIGHIVYRHGMRMAIQDSLLAFALLAMTGDVSGTSELFMGLPVMLTQLSYSREFEAEADGYALKYLRSRSIPSAHFARLMRRMEEKEKSALGKSKSKWASYLSTHPMTEERARRFE
ncbi:MAG: M48 family metallopeptidase [Thermodesulfobacteriota bacterium]|nr:M48 family metallopeptidase [Thermodesulfobacteriota bacterium]